MFSLGIKTILRRQPLRPCSPFHIRRAAAPVLSTSRAFPHLTSLLASDSGRSSPPPSTTKLDDPDRVRYRAIIDAESIWGYACGSYHPVMISDLLHGRYRVVDKLGFGTFSTVWLCHDVQLGRYVAVKVGVSDRPSPRREPDILRALSSSVSTSHSSTATKGSHVVLSVLHDFTIQGPNGSHPCYAMALAQGSLGDAAEDCIFPIRVARALAAKLAMAVAFVHSQGFIHGDIRLHNVLVKLTPSLDDLSIDQFREKFGKPALEPVTRVDGGLLPPNVPSQAVLPKFLGKEAQEFTLADAHGLVLGDFGEAFAPAVETRPGKRYNVPLASRPPEALFERDAPISYPADVWSLGIAIWDILGMRTIFSGWEGKDEVVAEQLDVFGAEHFPQSWREQWELPCAEGEDERERVPRRPTRERDIWPTLEEKFEESVQEARREMETYGEEAGVFGQEEKHAILDLMRGMLRFRPEERLTADQVLESEWMVRWALPELK